MVEIGRGVNSADAAGSIGATWLAAAAANDVGHKMPSSDLPPSTGSSDVPISSDDAMAAASNFPASGAAVSSSLPADASRHRTTVDDPDLLEFSAGNRRLQQLVDNEKQPEDSACSAVMVDRERLGESHGVRLTAAVDELMDVTGDNTQRHDLTEDATSDRHGLTQDVSAADRRSLNEDIAGGGPVSSDSMARPVVQSQTQTSSEHRASYNPRDNWMDVSDNEHMTHSTLANR